MTAEEHPLTRRTAARSLRVMAWINRLQAARQEAKGNPLLVRHHRVAAADFTSAADRLSSSTIHDPQSTISPVP